VTTPTTDHDWRTQHADAWGRTVLTVLGTAFPYGAAHVSLDTFDTDVDPAHLHPAFHGSFDWHSAVHMHWSAVRLLTLAPARLSDDTRSALVALLDERLTPAALQREAEYLRERPSWERPYGWAWAALLAAAARSCPLPQAHAWASALEPVADAVADLLLAWLPRLAYPVRHGVHSNTAFALALCHEAYGVLGREDVVDAVSTATRRWFTDDRDYPVAWEPSGSDFLSAGLCEADLVRRVLPAQEFAPWLAAFLPGLGREADPLLGVPEVLDRTDGHAVHLFGLGLSRAWQLRLLGPSLPQDAQGRIAAATARQVAVVEEEIVTGHFMSTHWLVSFALLAVTATEPAP
jgi:hypothetical protein